MDRFLLAALLFIVIVTVGFFGQHMGYTVDGVPAGGVNLKEWTDYPFFSPQLIVGFWEHIFTDTDHPIIAATIDYIYNFTTFQIDDVPAWLTLIVDLLVVLALILVFTLIRGGGGG
jgi:hypothetical protein